MAASRPSRVRDERLAKKTKNHRDGRRIPRRLAARVARAPERAREESAVSVVSKLSRPGLLDSNTTGNMIIVLSAGARRRSLGRGRQRRGQKGAPTWGCRGRQSIGRGRARTTPGSLRRDQSPIASDRHRARTGDRVDASARRFARRSDEGPPSRRHFVSSAKPRSRGKIFLHELHRRRGRRTDASLTRTISQCALLPRAPSTPVLASTRGTRCCRRRRRSRLEARVPLHALVSLEEMGARPRPPDPTRFAARCEG